MHDELKAAEQFTTPAQGLPDNGGYPFTTELQGSPPEPSPPSIIPYMPQLDGVRAVSVILVFVQHWVPGIFRLHISSGFIGVYTFYILSGFLITGILLRSRAANSAGIELTKFYARRVIRIFPLYYAALGVFTFLQIPGVRSTLLWDVTYTTNILTFRTGFWPGNVSHLWSLCVEEQFYLLWPFVILLAPRRSLRPVMLGCLAVAPVARLGLVLAGAASPSLKTFPLCSLDFLALGGIFAYKKFAPAEKDPQARLIPGSVALASLLMFLAVHFYLTFLGGENRFLNELGRPMFALLFLGWFVSTAATGFSGRTGKFLLHPVLSYLGRISYGLYLLHGFVPALWNWLLTRMGHPRSYDALSTPAQIFLNLAATLVLAVLSFHFFEQPLLRLKLAFPPGSERPPREPVSG